MADPTPNPVVAYIRENSSTYTRAAITENLLAQGFTQDEIDRAWREEESPPSATPQRVRPTVKAHLAVVGAWALLWASLTALYFGLRDYTIFFDLFEMAEGWMLLPVIGSLATGTLLVRRGWKVRAAIAWTFVATLALLLIVWGGCIAYIRFLFG